MAEGLAKQGRKQTYPLKALLRSAETGRWVKVRRHVHFGIATRIASAQSYLYDAAKPFGLKASVEVEDNDTLRARFYREAEVATK